MTIINSLFLLWKMQSGNLLKLKVDAKIKSTDFFFFFLRYYSMGLHSHSLLGEDKLGSTTE